MSGAADRIRLTFLGTGPSSGVPGVGIGWGACNPDNPRNQRTRQSVAVEAGGKRFIVDTTPDLRTQLLREGIDTADAVLYTHTHADHLHGIDDLRGINRAIGRPLPVFADAAAHTDIRNRFSYTLAPMDLDKPAVFIRPVLEMNEFVPGDDITADGVRVGTFPQDHGHSTTVGYWFGEEGGGLVYSTDVRTLSDDILTRLTRAKPAVWIIGVFSWTPHWTHAHVEKALAWIDRVKPQKAILTHLGTGIDYDELMAATPAHVVPAHDGLKVEIGAGGGEVRLID